MTDDVIARLRADLAALDAAYALGAHGRWAARRRARLVDDALAQVWARAGAPSGMALAAVGGYGRELQLPRSDIDLMIVHDGVDDAEIRRVADAVLYPLWDAGFAVGHAVRTPDETEAATARLDVWTAVMDARCVAGDEAIVADVADRATARARGDARGFVAALVASAEERHDRFGSCAHLLEPDLKEGSGGLRDLAALAWIRAASGKPLGEAGFIGEAEAAAADTAEEFLVRVRSAVHLAADRRADRLVVDLQAEVAEGFGFVDAPRLRATDALMRAVFEHARDVEAVSAAVTGRALAPPTPSAPPLRVGAEPAEVLRVLSGVSDAGGPPPTAVLDALATTGIPDAVVWTAEVRDAFLSLLRAGEPGAAMLDVLVRARLLERYLPCWADVRCRPQRDPYHRFTVDAHLTRATAVMAAMLRDPADPADPADPGREEMVNQVDRVDGLLLGTLLHDIGKIGEGAHVPLGTAIATAQLDAMGLETADRDLAVFMVAHHLLLPDTATRRDLSDEDLILDVAAQVGTRERLAALVLLAEADARATGPAAWTTWRRSLLSELVARVARVLERGDMGEELAARLTDRIQRVRDLLAGEPDADVDRFVFRMPRGYFLAVEPDAIARHHRTIAPPLGTNEVRTAAFDGGEVATSDLLLVARDSRGLLSQIAGALALGGISILSAQVFTTEDGIAVDLFVVEGAFDPVITEARWREFRTSLRRAVEGSISLEHRVADKRGHYPPPKVATPLTVRVDNDASDFSTVIEVGAPDRIGLLHDITLAFAELAVDVHVAKVATFDGRVVDAFYVRDPLGRKVTDAEQLGEIERSVRSRLIA